MKSPVVKRSIVVAGHKTHQRIHETLDLMRDARSRRE